MSETRRRAVACEAAADPDREPRQPWRWDRSRAWWVPAGDWADDHGLVVMKRGRDPKWYARAKRVGCVAATDTADQAKVALESWVAMVSDDAEQRRERSRLGKPSAPYALADDREPFQLTMREAVLLKRAAWDGPDVEPDSEDETVLNAALDRIETEHERRRAAHEG